MVLWCTIFISLAVLFDTPRLANPWIEENVCPIGRLQFCVVVQVRGYPIELPVHRGTIETCGHRRSAKVHKCTKRLSKMVWCFWCWRPGYRPGQCRWGWICTRENRGDERTAAFTGASLQLSCVQDDIACEDDVETVATPGVDIIGNTTATNFSHVNITSADLTKNSMDVPVSILQGHTKVEHPVTGTSQDLPNIPTITSLERLTNNNLHSEPYTGAEVVNTGASITGNKNVDLDSNMDYMMSSPMTTIITEDVYTKLSGTDSKYENSLGSISTINDMASSSGIEVGRKRTFTDISDTESFGTNEMIGSFVSSISTIADPANFSPREDESKTTLKYDSSVLDIDDVMSSSATEDEIYRTNTDGRNTGLSTTDNRISATGDMASSSAFEGGINTTIPGDCHNWSSETSSKDEEASGSSVALEESNTTVVSIINTGLIGTDNTGEDSANSVSIMDDMTNSSATEYEGNTTIADDLYTKPSALDEKSTSSEKVNSSATEYGGNTTIADDLYTKPSGIDENSTSSGMTNSSATEYAGNITISDDLYTKPTGIDEDSTNSGMTNSSATEYEGNITIAEDIYTKPSGTDEDSTSSASKIDDMTNSSATEDEGGNATVTNNINTGMSVTDSRNENSTSSVSSTDNLTPSPTEITSEVEDICELSEFHFEGHCYFLHDLPESGTEASKVADACSNVRSGALGVAVETRLEMDFVSRLLLEATGLTGSVLTSGVSYCEADAVWQHWGLEMNLEEVNSETLDTDNTTHTCEEAAYYVIIRKEGVVVWDLWNATWSATTTVIPRHVLCERDPAASTLNATAPAMQGTCQMICVAKDAYDRTWKVCSGSVGDMSCPEGASGSAVWVCGSNGKFTNVAPDFSACQHDWLAQATVMVGNNDTAEDILQFMHKWTLRELFFGHEIGLLLEVMGDSLALHEDQSKALFTKPEDLLNASVNFTQNATVLLDYVLMATQPWLQLKQKERVSMGERLGSLTEDLGFSLAAAAASRGDSVLYSASFEQRNVMVFGVQLFGHNKTEITFPSTSEHVTSYISIEAEPRRIQDRPRSVGMILANAPANLMFPGALNRHHCYRLATACSFNDQKILNSELMRFSLQDCEPTLTLRGVRVLLRHVRPAKGPSRIVVRRSLYPGETESAVAGSARCVFWNQSMGLTGMWDDTGCSVSDSGEISTLCECKHLSTFAVLMDVHNYVGKDATLEMVTWACCGASIVCLLLTLVVFHWCKSIQSERTSIGKHLCACLLAGHTVSLGLMDRSYLHLPDEACAVVAATIHYLMLVAFMWMSAEGHHLYRQVVRVFTSGQDLRRRYQAVCYGVPALVVGTTQTVATLRAEKAYGREDFCWLSSPHYIWSFIGPVVLLTACNSIVLVLALRAAVFAGISQSKCRRKKFGIWLKGWFTLTVLLGVTWFFGLTYMDLNDCFVYVFVILNGCQGVFIFLTRCIFNQQVWTAVVAEAKQRTHIASGSTHSGQGSQRSSGFMGTPAPTNRRYSDDSGRGDSMGEEPSHSLETRFENVVSMAPEGRDDKWAPPPYCSHKIRAVTVIRCPRIDEEVDHEC